jgi:hypothetical protein
VPAFGASAACSGRASTADEVVVGGRAPVAATVVVGAGAVGAAAAAAAIASAAGVPGTSAPSSSGGGGSTVDIQSESRSFSWVSWRMSYSAYSNSRLQKSASYGHTSTQIPQYMQSA